MKRIYLTILLLVMSISTLICEVIPHPWMQKTVNYKPSSTSDNFRDINNRKGKELPAKILVFMVEFDDVKFVTSPTYPDSLVHDQTFFNRYMLQLQDYLIDASNGEYFVEYDFYPQVVTADNSMGYYGNDDLSTERVSELCSEIVGKTDSEVDYNDYDTFFVFHAGAGQETDIEKKRKNELWSTFLGRHNLQEGLDPDNDDYQGIPADDTYVTNFVIAPEWQWQDYFPTDNPQYIFGSLGVIVTEFCYALGLPNLSDTDSSNGRSQGIGNWGIMGSGAWNAAGYTPALPSAWCRYYLGWYTPETISSDSQNIEITQWLSRKSNSSPKMYKLPISDKEYFLIENRAQNPDGSSIPVYDQEGNITGNAASYTFPLLPEGEQEYYADGTTPKFNFMKNRLKGCEWDFFLPGYSGGSYAPRDGSGLLIWHIDENVIAQKFNQDRGINRVNSDANHKGVDLEEADKIQHLDIRDNNIYQYGSPEDSFRDGNNNYIGLNAFSGLTNMPSTESYYGGLNSEIKNISPSGNTMTFDVYFRNDLSVDYYNLFVDDIGDVKTSAISMDLNDNGTNEVILPYGSQLFVWENKELISQTSYQGKVFNYMSFNDKSKELFIPTNNFDKAYLYSFDGNDLINKLSIDNATWQQPLILVEKSDAKTYKYYSAVRDNTTKKDRIIDLGEDLALKDEYSLKDSLYTNPVIYENKIYCPTRKAGGYSLEIINLDTKEITISSLPIEPYKINMHTVYPKSVSALIVDFIPDNNSMEYILQYENDFYIFAIDNDKLELIKRIPTHHKSLAKASLADYDNNGYWDLVVSYDTGVEIIAFNGEYLDNKRVDFDPSNDDEEETLNTEGGTFIFNNNGANYIAGNFSDNKTVLWEQKHELEPIFTFGGTDKSYNYPFLHLHKSKDESNNEITKLYLATTGLNGSTKFKFLNNVTNETKLSDYYQYWFTEYGNYQRNAVELRDELPNVYASNSTLISKEIYVYPNPYNALVNDKLKLKVMISKKSDVMVKIYNIAGKKVFSMQKSLAPYVSNNNEFELPLDKLASGIYFAIIEAEGEYKKIKFAIEK